MKSKTKYENMYGKIVEKNEYGCTPPAWKEELAGKCNNFVENPNPGKDFLEKILNQISKCLAHTESTRKNYQLYWHSQTMLTEV